MFIDGTTAPVLARTILMTADATGGVLTYALTLASELAKHGTKTHLALMGPKARPEQEAIVRAIPGLVLHESTHALEWMDETLVDGSRGSAEGGPRDEPWAEIARATEWLRDLEKQVRPDIIHLNGYSHGAAGFTAPVVIVAHSCLLSRWEAVEGSERPATHYATYKEAVRRGLSAAAAVIAVSQSMRADLDRHYGPLARVAIVPNGLLVESAPQDRGAKEKLLLAAGRVWDRAKNVEILGRIAKDLPWSLKVAGGSAPPKVGTTFAGTSSLTGHDRIEEVGWLSPADLGKLMDKASIFVSPARYEPFGLTALEAALRGCALILGDLPSQREIWGDTATFVRPNDEKALVDALTKLTKDDALRERLADAANLRARLYTPARNARAMRDLYEAILHARRIPVPFLRGHASRPM